MFDGVKFLLSLFLTLFYDEIDYDEFYYSR